MPLAYLAAILVAGLSWRVPLGRMWAATAEGVIIAGMLLYIIFGALLLFLCHEAFGSRGGHPRCF